MNIFKGLRVLGMGNYLEDDIGNVVKLDKETLPLVATKWIKCHHSIRLTREWLKKFYFEEALNGWWSPCEQYCYREGNLYLGANIFLAKIDYVHQLQNCYMALENKEL
jgi:hypothetical protein